jgi:hypothetical protein
LSRATLPRIATSSAPSDWMTSVCALHPRRTWMWSKVLPSISTPVPSIWIASPVRRSKWLPRMVRPCVPVIARTPPASLESTVQESGPSWKWLPSKRMSREPRMFTAFVRSLSTNAMWSLPK